MHSVLSVCFDSHSARVLSFNKTASSKSYSLSLHDALPIFFTALQRHLEERAQALGSSVVLGFANPVTNRMFFGVLGWSDLAHYRIWARPRSEEHTSELQSRRDLVCRLLLVKKNALCFVSLL